MHALHELEPTFKKEENKLGSEADKMREADERDRQDEEGRVAPTAESIDEHN